MTTTTHQASKITTNRMVGLFAALCWGAFVIGGPLSLAIIVHIPAGHIGMAAGCLVMAAIMSAPWFVFGLPVVRRFVSSIR